MILRNWKHWVMVCYIGNLKLPIATSSSIGNWLQLPIACVQQAIANWPIVYSDNNPGRFTWLIDMMAIIVNYLKEWMVSIFVKRSFTLYAYNSIILVVSHRAPLLVNLFIILGLVISGAWCDTGVAINSPEHCHVQKDFGLAPEINFSEIRFWFVLLFPCIENHHACKTWSFQTGKRQNFHLLAIFWQYILPPSGNRPHV